MESIPYDKRSGKIWFNGKTVDWADANIHILIMDCIMPAVYLKERGFMREISLNWKITPKDFFILLKEWALKFLTLRMKLMKRVKL